MSQSQKIRISMQILKRESHYKFLNSYVIEEFNGGLSDLGEHVSELSDGTGQANNRIGGRELE